MSESAEVSDPLIDVVVDELLIDAHPNRVAMEERQRIVEEGCIESRLPQVDSDDEFVVALEIAALLRRLPYSK